MENTLFDNEIRSLLLRIAEALETIVETKGERTPLPPTPSKPATRRAWTEDDDKQLIYLHFHGLSADEIAEKLGRTRSSVWGRVCKIRRRRVD